jgi:hypothetical protein
MIGARVPCLLALLMFFFARPATGGAGESSFKYQQVARQLLAAGMKDGESFSLLRELTSTVGSRLSGSPGAAKAVELVRRMLMKRGFDNVHLEPVMVPHWVRGPVESAVALPSRKGKPISLAICALGGSIATPNAGITAEVVEVKSFDDLHRMGERARGKIVFFNRPMDPTKLNTFEAYSGAVDQRSAGAVEAALAGGVAALVRSMTLALDNVPHTGVMGYRDSVARVPAAAVSTMGAETLARLLREDRHLKVHITLSCRTLPDVQSANVMGEIRGSASPEEIIVVGGHLDSWDKGVGAHDDGSGCVQAIEVLNLIRKLNLRPKRTIRAVLFMNEENGNRGGRGYVTAPGRSAEKQYAAIESDRGGFDPRGFSVQADSTVFTRTLAWQDCFDLLEAGKIARGFSGVDIFPTVEKGVPGFGLDVDSQRYFDYHHSNNDTLDKVNPRELEMGAIVEALLCYLISEEGL